MSKERNAAVLKAILKKGAAKNKSEIAANLSTYSHVIGDILAGFRNFTRDMIERLAKVYLVDVRYLFELSDSMFVCPSDPYAALERLKSELELAKKAILILNMRMLGHSVSMEADRIEDYISVTVKKFGSITDIKHFYYKDMELARKFYDQKFAELAGEIANQQSPNG